MITPLFVLFSKTILTQEVTMNFYFLINCSTSLYNRPKVFNEDFLDLLDRFSRDVVSPTSSESTYYDHRSLETKWTAGGYHCSKSIPAHERVQVLVSLYQKDPQYYSVIDFCSYCGWNDGKYPGKKDINRRRWQDYYAFKNYVSMINSR